MSKMFKYIKLLFMIISVFVIQILVANNFEIFGVTPNIILVTLVIISMWNDMSISLIVAGILGIGVDLLFYFNIGQAFVSYLVITVSVLYIRQKYRRDSKAAIIYIIIISTVAFASLEYIYYAVNSEMLFNIFDVIKQTIIEILLNISVAYILYKIFEKSMQKKELEDFYTSRR